LTRIFHRHERKAVEQPTLQEKLTHPIYSFWKFAANRPARAAQYLCGFILRVLLENNGCDKLLSNLAQLLESTLYIMDEDDSILKAGHPI